MWDTQWASNTPKVERETAEKVSPGERSRSGQSTCEQLSMKIISRGRRKAKAGNKCKWLSEIFEKRSEN